MAEKDKVINHHGSTIQHGSYNDRIYLMKLAPMPDENYPFQLIDLAKRNRYSKIFAKIPENHAKIFFDAGFLKEACIPKFYYGKEAAVFMGFYLNSKRATEAYLDRMEEIISIALAKETEDLCSLNFNQKVRACEERDAEALANIYKDIFTTYPFPIHDPDYILKTMRNNVDYFGIESDSKLVAVSSAEMDKHSSNVEMTDFATLRDYRGHGYAKYLLARMDLEMKKKNIKTAYTIARSMSPGMNITFSKAGYQFGGRLKNNTNISGNIESMNIWYKSLVD